MDMRTGEITEMSEEMAKKFGIKEISREEVKAMSAVPQQKRPAELEAQRFFDNNNTGQIMPFRLRLKDAFLTGYKKAEENLNK